MTRVQRLALLLTTPAFAAYAGNGLLLLTLVAAVSGRHILA